MLGGVVRGRLWSRASGSPLRRLLDEASEFGERETGSAGADELHWATQPYAERRAPVSRASPATDPRHTTVLLFPGRGAHRPTAASRRPEVPAAAELYELASTILGWDVRRASGEGEEEEAADTCAVVRALAALERARAERPGAVQRARAAAGVGAGELAALVFAGALSLEAALRVLQVRAAALRACHRRRPGGTLALWLAPDARLGDALHAAREYAAERGVRDPVCQVSGYLYPGCKLVAGDEEAVRWVQRHGGAHGVVRAARVRHAGAAHCALAADAGQAVRAALRAAGGLREPRVQLVSAGAGGAVRGAAGAARALCRGPAGALRWEQALHALYARPAGTHFPLTLVLGDGAALRDNLRRVNAPAWDSSLLVEP